LRGRIDRATWIGRCAPRTAFFASPSIQRSPCCATITRMADACGPTPPSPPVQNKSGRTVFCTKFQKDLPGLDAPPWPGELGQRIYETVSAQAWEVVGRAHENDSQRVPPDALAERGGEDLIAKHMEDFFFGEGAALPPGYVPQQAK